MKNNLLVKWSEIDNCVLDMDGTLLDLHFDDIVWNVRLPHYYAKQTGCTLAAAQDYIKSNLQKHRGSLNWYSFPHWKKKLGIDISSIEAEILHLVTVKKNTLHFLEKVKQKQKKLVLATNAYPSSMERKLAITGVDTYFDHMINSHEIGSAKEEAGFWDVIYRKLNLHKKKTLIVDDNLNVLRAASEFGFSTLYAISFPSSNGRKKNTEEFPSLNSLSDLI